MDLVGDLKRTQGTASPVVPLGDTRDWKVLLALFLRPSRPPGTGTLVMNVLLPVVDLLPEEEPRPSLEPLVDLLKQVLRRVH